MGSVSDSVYLAAAEYIDSDHATIEAFVPTVVTLDMSAAEKARRLYVATREMRYDPDLDFDDPETYRASSVLLSRAGYCVGNIKITTDGSNIFTVSADGAVHQGPNELVASGLV